MKEYYIRKMGSEKPLYWSAKFSRWVSFNRATKFLSPPETLSIPKEVRFKIEECFFNN